MEQTLPMHNPAPAGLPTLTEKEHQPHRGPLELGDIMSRDPVTVPPQDTIASAARRMSEQDVSCVMVVEEGRVAGILTEKDVLKGVADRQADFRSVRVSQRMSSPVFTVAPGLSVLEAGRIMGERNIRRLPVVQDGRLVGIVTETDIARGLISLNPLRYISDIMTRHVSVVDTDAEVEEAAQIMSHQNISCVVARHRQKIAGIVTEKDILRRIVALHKDPTQTRVAEIMSFPVVAVPPTYSVLSASRKMETVHVHRLIVMDDKRIHGVVTQTDILRAIRGAFEMVEQQRREVAAQFADLMRNVAQDLAQMQEFLDQIQNVGAPGGSPAHTTGKPALGSTEIGACCVL